MTIKIEVTEEPKKKNWDQILKKSTTSHIHNTIEWSKVMEKAFSYKPVYITAKENEKEVGCLSLLEKQVTYIPILKNYTKILFTYAPPVAIGKKEEETTRKIIKAAIKYSKKNHIASTNIWASPYWDKKEAFQKNGFTKEEKHNILIDLKTPKEEALKHLEKGLRKNIRRALDEKHTFIETPTYDDLKEYYTIYKNHHLKLNLFIYPFSYLKAIWDHLISKDMAKFIIVKYNNKIGAGLIYSTFNSRMYELSIASSSEHHAYFPNDLLKWKAIEWGIKNNYKTFDISNVPVNPKKGTKEHGILRFKKKWGQIVSYNVYKKRGTIGKIWDLRKKLIN